jgi:hypothetical protein
MPDPIAKAAKNSHSAEQEMRRAAARYNAARTDKNRRAFSDAVDAWEVALAKWGEAVCDGTDGIGAGAN